MLDTVRYDNKEVISYRLVERFAALFKDMEYRVSFNSFCRSGSIWFNDDATHIVAKMHGLETNIPIRPNSWEELGDILDDMGCNEEDYLFVIGKFTSTLYVRDNGTKTMLYLKVPECFYNNSISLP